MKALDKKHVYAFPEEFGDSLITAFYDLKTTQISARVIEGTTYLNADGTRKTVTTFLIKFHRWILAEVNTHRVASKNSESSRAVPVEKALKQVWNKPMYPVKWGEFRKGMASGDELSGWRLRFVKAVWFSLAKINSVGAWLMRRAGLAKEFANRVLETWREQTTVITFVDFDKGNFLGLRDHPMAQPEFRELARCMREAFDRYQNRLVVVPDDHAQRQELTGSHEGWHLPFVLLSERENPGNTLEDLLTMSVARSARTSYNNFDLSSTSKTGNERLAWDLIKQDPIHASPFEHQVTFLPSQTGALQLELSGNLVGVTQLRKVAEGIKSYSAMIGEPAVDIITVMRSSIAYLKSMNTKI